MGNMREVFNNIIKNKNTVTILLVFAGIIGLYVVYNNRVKVATQLVDVPYAKSEITAQTVISSQMISYAQVPNSILNRTSNLIQNSGEITGKQVKEGMTIPAGSFFYKDSISQVSSTPEHTFNNIPDGYKPYQLEVDFDSTYANSIYPGNRIDLFIKTTDESGKIIFGRLIKGIQVLYVDDSEGKNVFASTTDAKKPKYMYFAVTEEMSDLLEKAKGIPGLKIMPIPRNESYSSDDRTAEIDSTFLQTHILSKYMIIN